MAVDEFSRETDTLVLPNKTFFPASIPVTHYQLRHYISSPEKNLVYYASRETIYALDTERNKRFQIAALPFEVRCTASGYGWVCVGGDAEGQVAVVKVDGSAPPPPADVDTPLPLRQTLGRSGLGVPKVQLESIGRDRVNSISIHKLPSLTQGEEDEVVAVLTNNDKTVRIWSLTHGLELAALEFPFCMNHATISPSGRFMVAVGDYNYGFFFERVKPGQLPSYAKGPGTIESTSAEWVEFSTVNLHHPSATHARGYFTTAWSPSGDLCAVGSECGYITIFDINLVLNSECGEEAVVQIIRSSRPDTEHGPGSVRCLCFAPQPWDLLIWGEAQARVCVADLRSGLKTRQILELDPKEEGLKKVEIEDVDLESDAALSLEQEADYLRRFRRAMDAESTSTGTNLTADYLEAALRRSRHPGVVESDDDPHGLTPEERQILEALRTTRERERQTSRPTGSTTTQTPRSITYSNGAEAHRVSGPPSSDFPALRANAGLSVTVPSLASIRDLFQRDRDLAQRERNLEAERERLEDERLERERLERERLERQARRPTAIVVAAESSGSGSNSALSSRSPGPIPPHAQRAEHPPPPIDPWRTIEAAMARGAMNDNSSSSSRPSGVTLGDMSAELRLLEARENINELRRFRHLARSRVAGNQTREPRSTLNDYSNLGYTRRNTLSPTSECGVVIAGLALSQDGRQLYVGTAEGIFEFTINLNERKLFPSIVPR